MARMIRNGPPPNARTRINEQLRGGGRVVAEQGDMGVIRRAVGDHIRKADIGDDPDDEFEVEVNGEVWHIKRRFLEEVDED